MGKLKRKNPKLKISHSHRHKSEVRGGNVKPIEWYDFFQSEITCWLVIYLLLKARSSFQADFGERRTPLLAFGFFPFSITIDNNQLAEKKSQTCRQTWQTCPFSLTVTWGLSSILYIPNQLSIIHQSRRYSRGWPTKASKLTHGTNEELLAKSNQPPYLRGHPWKSIDARLMYYNYTYVTLGTIMSHLHILSGKRRNRILMKRKRN